MRIMRDSSPDSKDLFQTVDLDSARKGTDTARKGIARVAAPPMVLSAQRNRHG